MPSEHLPRADRDADLNQLSTLLETLPCGAALIDRAGRIVRLNSRLCEMMQRRADQLAGQTLLDLYAGEDERQVVRHVLAHFDEPREQEFRLPLPTGTFLPVIACGRAVPSADGHAQHRLVTLVDLSRHKRAESDLRERYQDIAALSDTVLEQALQLKRYSRELEQRVRERTRDLHVANMEAIYMLAVASEAKDVDTGAHVRRIENLTRLLAIELGLSNADAERMGYSAILHDVGKIHVPDEILRKPGPLSEEEWATMRSHTIAGERILSREPFFGLARSIARSHHENWDGSGYPDGLRRESIPLEARIVRVADVYDALTSTRPYKIAWKPQAAAATIEKEQQRLFDPTVSRAFGRLFQRGAFVSPA
jgi:PAS domain S-box-containing protein